METKLDKVFNALLDKNDLARKIRTMPELELEYFAYRLASIETALGIALNMLNARDNQPSVKEILESKENI